MTPMRLEVSQRARLFAWQAGIAALCLTAGVGCQDDVVTQFPAGLVPIEANTATLPAGTPADPYPEERVVLSGEDSHGAWLHAYGYVKAPIALVWTAFQDPAVVIDRRAITSYTTTLDVEPEYDVSFKVRYVIEDVVTVMFDVNWRESATEGTVDAPTRVIVAYQKTWGSSFLRRMAGTIELVQITPDITQIGWVQRLDATNTNAATLESWNADQFTNVIHSVRGEPLLVF